MTQHDEADGAIRVERSGHVLLIGIDRPAKYNAFSKAMAIELGDAFAALESDDEIRVGMLHAFGRNFTAGVQLDQIGEWFAAGRRLGQDGKPDPFDLQPPLRTKPIVAAVQGYCFTVAIELMLAADIVIAADDARFGQIEVKRGIFANHGATLRIVERAGWGNAMRYLLTGDEFDAATALRLGLVQEVVPAGRQFDRALAIAETIAAQAPLAVRETIRSARRAVFEGWPAAIADLGPAQARLMKSDDAAEGVASFMERRAGTFRGT